MALKAVLFDFNGVIINDEPIHKQLIEEILLTENLVLKKGEYEQTCLGKSERDCFRTLIGTRGRVLREDGLAQLLQRKLKRYIEEMQKLEKLPVFPGIDDLIFQIRTRNLKLGIVSEALREEIDLVLQGSNLSEYFQVIVSGEDVTTTKPEPDGYMLAVQRLNERFPDLNLLPRDCLVIEDTLLGIQAAKRARMQVVGVAHTYPFHMLQRKANWTVDFLMDLDLERVTEVYRKRDEQAAGKLKKENTEIKGENLG